MTFGCGGVRHTANYLIAATSRFGLCILIPIWVHGCHLYM